LTSDKENKINVKKYLGVFFTVILALLLLYYAFKDVSFNGMMQSLRNISIGWFLLFILFFYLSHYLRAVRWKVMIKDVKKDASIINLFGAVMIGYGVNVAVPRLGELYRGLFLGRWEGISRASMLGSIILERFIDILSFTVGALICIYIYSGNLFEKITWLNSALIIGFVLILIFIIFLFSVILFKERIKGIVLRITGTFSQALTKRVETFFDTLIVGFSSISDIRGYVETFIYSVLILLCYALSTWAGFYSLGMETTGNVNFEMAWIFMIISAFGVIIPTPGGFGSYHALSIVILTSLYGFNKDISAAYALLTHTAQVVLFILSTFFFFAVINNINARKGKKKEDFISVFRVREKGE